jgi:putative GTP pyrophosphokinase
MAERDALAHISKKRVTKAGKALRDDLTGKMELPKDVRDEYVEIVDEFRKAHGRPLASVAANVVYYVKEYRDEDLGTGKVVQRLKRRRTIIDKLTRHPNMALSTMQDIGGCRAVLPTEADVYRVADRLQRQKRWELIEVYDYIARPKPDGYRALHLIERRHGCRIEVQLRSVTQHSWAEVIEATDRQSAFGELKLGRGPDILARYYALGAELLAEHERGEAIDPQQLQQFRELDDRIFGERRRKGGDDGT